MFDKHNLSLNRDWMKRLVFIFAHGKLWKCI